MKLLLFDIDGTLLTTHGSGRRAVEDGLAALVGHPVSTEGISFSGKTDPQILREVLAASACEPHWLDGRFPECIDAYVSAVERLAGESKTTELDGAVALTEACVAHAGCSVGLLTGNIEPMAYRKVGAIRLGRDHFPFGAFGSDHEDRNELPAIGAERGAAHAGRDFAPEDVVILGDTPRDIACARAFGARAVIVATGRFDRDELAAHDPDVLFDDLRDTRAVMEALLA